MILLGVFRTPNIVDVLLLADLSRWPIIYLAQVQTVQSTKYAPSSAMISPMGGLTGSAMKRDSRGEWLNLLAVNQIIPGQGRLSKSARL